MRDLATAIVSAVNSDHVDRVVMVHFAFEEPVYVHSGLGEVDWNGQTYYGVGTLGSIGDAEESEGLTAQTITFTLSGLDQMQVRVALNAADFNDQVTVSTAYIDESGDIIGHPIVTWAGSVDTCAVNAGPEPTVTITAEHDLADLDRKHGGRWTNEDHQKRWPGDEFFEHIHLVPNLRLKWGGGPTVTGHIDRDRPLRGGSGGRTYIP